MRTLAFDTSGKSQGVALLVDGQVQKENHISLPINHSETLLQSIQEVLSVRDYSLGDIDLFAITMGPGSFTGLRIGLSTLKAFSLVHDRPVVGICSLLALALPRLKDQRLVISCVAARRGEFYVACYRNGPKNGDYEILLEPQVLEERSMVQRLNGLEGEKLLVGSGALLNPHLLGNIRGASISNEGHEIRASVVGRLGEALMIQGMGLSGIHLKPVYLRVSEAERKLRERQGLSGSFGTPGNLGSKKTL